MSASTTTVLPAMDDSIMCEMIKNLASVNEKLYRWEQSVQCMKNIPDYDANKRALKEIIDFINKDDSTPREKAVYLYGQLAKNYTEQQNFMGAAKAYERAATMRFDCFSDSEIIDKSAYDDVKMTVQYLERAIDNYVAISKFKHVGTLHYRCSRILRLINAPVEDITRHYTMAINYFTKRRKEMLEMALPIKRGFPFVSDYPNTGTKKFFGAKNMQRYHEKQFNVFECSSNSSQESPFMSPQDVQLQKTTLIEPHDEKSYKYGKPIEERVESAKKLVKKLRRFCAHYEVTSLGPDAGRVFCKMCERHLGAVSSTLKNHVNTQEHKTALEEYYQRNPHIPGQSLVSPQQSSIDFDNIDLSWIVPPQPSADSVHDVRGSVPNQMIYHTLSNA